MSMQRQFAYGPRWRIILYFFAAGTGMIALARLHVISFAVGAGLAALPLGIALLAILRRLAFPCYLELGQDTLSIGSEYFRARITKVPYAEIEHTWEVVAGTMTLLRLRTKERTVEIISSLLPDMASYVAVRDFLNSRVVVREQIVPPVEAGKYCFRCSYEGDGEIYNSNGEIIRRFKTLHTRPHYPYGLFRLPDFVVYDQAEKEVLRIKLERKWGLGKFVMVENGSPVCTIRQRSILRNKFTLDCVDGRKWTFRMPLFTAYFRGSSELGEEIRVGVSSHNVWYVLIDAQADSPRLVAALAFIHRERLRFN